MSGYGRFSAEFICSLYLKEPKTETWRGDKEPYKSK